MITEYISGIREKVSVQNEEIIKFNISLLRAHILNKAVLYELFKPYGITNAGLDDLINVIEGNTGGQIFTETFRIMNNRKDLIVSALDSGEESIYFVDDPDGIVKVPGILSAVIITISDRFEIPSDPLVACLDSEKVLFPVTIRKWRAGDHFYPLGMQQKKKLSDYFIDEKYSRLDKEKILILESDAKIAWIIGERIDDRFKITGTTKKALVITLLK
jgi:tRNA(Ile)-lysidine synthase